MYEEISVRVTQNEYPGGRKRTRGRQTVDIVAQFKPIYGKDRFTIFISSEETSDHFPLFLWRYSILHGFLTRNYRKAVVEAHQN